MRETSICRPLEVRIALDSVKKAHGHSHWLYPRPKLFGEKAVLYPKRKHTPFLASPLFPPPVCRSVLMCRPPFTPHRDETNSSFA